MLNINHLTTTLIRYAKKDLKSAYEGEIYHFPEIDSTNTWLLEKGNVGDFCISDTQTAGRGRRDNEWVSPPSGSIYLSYCCRVEKDVPRRSLMSLLVGIAVAEALKECGLSGHGVKWPNDILWRQKKMGGVLIQIRNCSETFIIGIGLNISLLEQSHSKISQPAVSLDEAMQGKAPAREVVLLALMKNLLFYTELFPQLSFPFFLKSWEQWDLLKDQSVTLERQNDEISGIVEGVDEHGRLAMVVDGGTQFFSVGDVRMKKKPY